VQGFSEANQSKVGRKTNWDKRTSTLKCCDCGLTLTIGLLAWPRKIGGKGTTTRPADQVPSERQLVQIRNLGGGLWMPEGQAKSKWRAEDTNYTAGCTCPEDWPRKPSTEAPTVDPDCPIHGEGT
jgi:hypothetical protein